MLSHSIRNTNNMLNVLDLEAAMSQTINKKNSIYGID
jgi:hypothetical protein